MKILNVVGARPNFVKIAPLLREMRHHPEIEAVLVHTGQHYDAMLSDHFFVDLEIPAPEVNLGVGSASHATQTAEVMRRLEPVLESLQPDVVVVVGDVNSTLAAALTAVKLGIRVAHVEAGLRSFDRRMPEEINRVLTDAIADMLFVTEESGRANLLREGIAADKIHFVGNVMIDALEAFRPRWQRSSIFTRLRLSSDQPYGVLTLHRPSNVDDSGILTALLAALQEIACRFPIVFPVHPRVEAKLSKELGGHGPTGAQGNVQGLATNDPGWLVPWAPLPARDGELLWMRMDSGEPFPERGIICLPPVGYLDFVALMSRARIVLTDSGGIQEETSILGVPCLTLRDTTERPVTVTHGTNRVIGTDPQRIRSEIHRTLDHLPVRPSRPPLWDGHAADRVVEVLLEHERRRTAATLRAPGLPSPVGEPVWSTTGE